MGGSGTGWKRRWFALKPGCLKYYESEARKELRGEVQLSLANVSLKQHKRKQWAFQVQTTTRVIYLAAENQEINAVIETRLDVQGEVVAKSSILSSIGRKKGEQSQFEGAADRIEGSLFHVQPKVIGGVRLPGRAKRRYVVVDKNALEITLYSDSAHTDSVLGISLLGATVTDVRTTTSMHPFEVTVAGVTHYFYTNTESATTNWTGALRAWAKPDVALTKANEKKSDWDLLTDVKALLASGAMIWSLNKQSGKMISSLSEVPSGAWLTDGGVRVERKESSSVELSLGDRRQTIASAALVVEPTVQRRKTDATPRPTSPPPKDKLPPQAVSPPPLSTSPPPVTPVTPVTPVNAGSAPVDSSAKAEPNKAKFLLGRLGDMAKSVEKSLQKGKPRGAKKVHFKHGHTSFSYEAAEPAEKIVHLPREAEEELKLIEEFFAAVRAVKTSPTPPLDAAEEVFATYLSLGSPTAIYDFPPNWRRAIAFGLDHDDVGPLFNVAHDMEEGMKQVSGYVSHSHRTPPLPSLALQESINEADNQALAKIERQIELDDQKAEEKIRISRLSLARNEESEDEASDSSRPVSPRPPSPSSQASSPPPAISPSPRPSSPTPSPTPSNPSPSNASQPAPAPSPRPSSPTPSESSSPRPSSPPLVRVSVAPLIDRTKKPREGDLPSSPPSLPTPAQQSSAPAVPVQAPESSPPPPPAEVPIPEPKLVAVMEWIVANAGAIVLSLQGIREKLLQIDPDTPPNEVLVSLAKRINNMKKELSPVKEVMRVEHSSVTTRSLPTVVLAALDELLAYLSEIVKVTKNGESRHVVIFAKCVKALQQFSS